MERKSFKSALRDNFIISCLTLGFQMRCRKCSKPCIKKGFQSNGKQRFYCKHCGKSQQRKYESPAFMDDTNRVIVSLLKEGVGIRGISRLTKVSPNTVMRRILKISKAISKPKPVFGREYEMDELCTTIGNKIRIDWIAYAIERTTKQVVDFRVGSRSLKTLRGVSETLILSQAKRIFTDKLRLYKTLIPKGIHSTKLRATNHIERKNLTLRTHLKYLTRRTICFSRSVVMLVACLRIYFWSGNVV